MAGERVLQSMFGFWLKRLSRVFAVLWCALVLAACGSASQAPKAGGMPGSAPSEGAVEKEAAADEEFSLFGGDAASDASAPSPAQAPAPARAEAAGNALGAPAPPPAAPGVAAPPSEAPQPDTAPLTEPGAGGPLLIYRATLHMAVFETRAAMDAIEKLARQSGGYLVARDDLTITIRVPAARFESILDQVGKQGDELHREVSVSDVTEQFNDLSIRLKNAEAVRDRLAALLAKAQNVEEALAVEQQLARVAESIELYKGKLKLLRELVAFSTISVRFEARPVDKVGSKVELPFYWLKELGLPELLNL